MAFGAESRMRSRRARISMMAQETETFRSRAGYRKRKTYHLQIITFGLQRAGRSIQMGQLRTYDRKSEVRQNGCRLYIASMITSGPAVRNKSQF